MRSRASAFLLVLCAWPVLAQTPYKVALPGYRYEFPRDNFNHPDFQTEWWYYTGNVTDKDGHRFGFELTFFRQGVSRVPEKTATWEILDIYFAHLALSDLDGKTYYHSERRNRAGPGIAGVDAGQARIWNGNWSVSWKAEDQTLAAVDQLFSFSFALHPEKPPVIHGENGINQKAEAAGHASHYISLTRLKTDGTIEVNGKSHQVSGVSWMDHEFFTHQPAKDQIGWDWMSIELNDKTELMLYRIRRTDGSTDSFSSATYVDPYGRSFHLRKEDFSLQPAGETWKSPLTKGVYPVAWHIVVPKLGIDLQVATPLKTQEFTGKSQWIPSYWEGAIELSGHHGPADVKGVGYLEMTGYDRPVVFGE